MIYQGKKRYPVHEAVLHTADVAEGWEHGKSNVEMLREIRRWHVQDNGWRDIGYHRVIAPDGTIMVGRSIYQIGAGVLGHNRGVVHICMININPHAGIKTFDDYFTPAQRRAVIGYLDDLGDLTDLQKVSGHNDYARRECPGFKVHQDDWYPGRLAA